MKKLFFTILAACTLSGVLAAQTPTAVQAPYHPLWNEGITGSVKAIHAVEYDAKPGANGKVILGDSIGCIDIKCGRDGRMFEQIVREEACPDGYSRYVFTYNGEGRCMGRYIYYESGEMNVCNIYLYDADDDPWQIRTYNGEDGEYIVLCTMEYDGDQIIEKEFLGSQDPQDTEDLDADYTYTYDLRGNMLTETGSDGEAYRYEYEYDKQGNWTKQIRYVVSGDEEEAAGSGVVDRVVRRTIMYW